MPTLPSWLTRPPASAPAIGAAPQLPTPAPRYSRVKDPNVPDHRLLIASRCIYERQLPGGSYITAHVERLQCGYYDTPVIHEDCITNVRFLGIHFTFHEASTERRFKGATIKLGLHVENAHPEGFPLPPQIEHPNDDDPVPPQEAKLKPKFLRHSPHLLYGAMSPESLDWNFNLAGSLGVAQTPVSASINPSGGVKSSYKVYKMMKIQGSLRTNSSWYGKHYDLEDGELVWTLEENELQKSGLPREFTFVMMLTKGDSSNDVRLEVDIEPQVATWFGSYPQWWIHTIRYQPFYKEPLNLDKEIGQKFEPVDGSLGFNFAGLMSTFDNFVSLPGTMYSTHDWSVTDTAPPTGDGKGSSGRSDQAQANTSNTVDTGNSSNTLHLRIHLDQASKLGKAISASTYPYPESQVPVKSGRSPPRQQQIASPQLSSKSELGTKPTANKSAKTTRGVTINSGFGTTPPKHRVPRVTPLQTHYEEQPYVPSKKKAHSDDEESNQEYEFAFPEVIPFTPPSLPRQSSTVPKPNTADHRHTVSASSAASSAAAGHKITSGLAAAETSPPTQKTALGSHPSLRRTRSRSGLRGTSLTSQPEDEEAIAAAMDMLSGSPPPPDADLPQSKSAPPRPVSSVADLFPSDETVLATPRTRATLADLMEIERAENARIRRRNGQADTSQSATPAHDQSLSRSTGLLETTDKERGAVSRDRDRDYIRQKRYSMPVTSTGVGYSIGDSNRNTVSDNEGFSGGRIFNSQDDSLNTRTSNARPISITDTITGRNNDGGGNKNRTINITSRPFTAQNASTAGNAFGNGRSSLMIPIGTHKRDSFPLPSSSSTTTTTATAAAAATPASSKQGLGIDLTKPVFKFGDVIRNHQQQQYHIARGAHINNTTNNNNSSSNNNSNINASYTQNSTMKDIHDSKTQSLTTRKANGNFRNGDKYLHDVDANDDADGDGHADSDSGISSF